MDWFRTPITASGGNKFASRFVGDSGFRAPFALFSNFLTVKWRGRVRRYCGKCGPSG